MIKNIFGSKSGYFIYKNNINSENDQYYNQGYKIHVSATEDSAFKIFSLLYNELISKDIFFKVVNGSKNLVKLNKDPIQQGKFITIYPKNDFDAFKIATNLDKILKQYTTKDDFIRSPHDAQLGSSGGLSTRYGLFIPYPHRKNQIKKIEKGQISNEFIEDNRASGYKPDFIDWQPFQKLLSDNISNAPKIYFQGADRNLPKTNNSTYRRKRR